MTLAKRQDDPVVRGCGLKFEIKGHAEPFSERQSPGPVDAGTQRGMQNQLHPPGLVEEALGYNEFAGRHGTEDGLCLANVRDHLFCCGFGDAGLTDQPADSSGNIIDTFCEMSPYVGDRI